jgi:KUP system potassium uptake protein
MDHSYFRSSLLTDSFKSLGIVFGDIGTSPIYTLPAIFAFLPANPTDVIGILSAIIWTLILLVSVQYAWLAMSLASKEDGEGGIVVLKEILVSYLKSPVTIVFATILSFLGISFFIGDGVITPAMSILSAVEGIVFIPGLETISLGIVIGVALIITLGLFAFQQRGTERVSLAFGPIMFIWFLFLGAIGIYYIAQQPSVLKAINPLYALRFFYEHGFLGILLLSKVILCATGGEALYADMGHLGRRPIRIAWAFVFIALCLTYLGQGAFLLSNPQEADVFYKMILLNFKPLYIPLLILSIMATVIASQALISGLFSIVYQGITTHIMPRLHVEYTSQRFMSQIYIPLINWVLFVLVALIILTFQDSKNLANAYGLAVSGTMTITALLLTWIFIYQRHWLKAVLSGFLIPLNCLFFTVNTYKIPYGGYWSLIIASVPLCIIVIYTLGRRRLNQSLKEMPLSQFVERFTILSDKVAHINGTAVFLCKSYDQIPLYVAQTMFTNHIVYEENILVNVITERRPFGLVAGFKEEDLAHGLRVFEIRVGYLEQLNLEKIFNAAYIHPKVIFYGGEEISTKNIFWHIFVIIKRLTPSFVQFYKLPRNKLHGVIIRVEI